MMTQGRAAALGLTAALLAAACQSHSPPKADSREACAAADVAPALFKRLQGRWEVAFKEYLPGQKPPVKPRIGALELEGCRFRFIPREDAEPGNAGQWLPFVTAPTGVMEIVVEGPAPTDTDANDQRRWLGTLRLHVDAAGDEGRPGPSIWEAMVFERPQESEYLYFAPTTEVKALPWEIHRGTFRPESIVAKGALTRQPRPPAPEPVVMDQVLPTPRCSLAALKDAPEQALAAVIAELPVEASFACPATYRLVQRQGPYYTYVGTDAATGDRAWVTLVHDPGKEVGERVSWNRSQEYGAKCRVRGPMPAGWFCVRASARTHSGAAPLQAWLTAHPAVDAVDWISFALNPHDKPDWRALPRVFHLHADRATTLCWQRGAARRCWRHNDVDRSRIDEGGLSADVEIVTTAGGHDTTWTLSADGALTGETDADPWQAVESAPSELTGLYPRGTIQTRADGVVALGRYDQVGGDGGISLDTFAEWLLVRRSDAWTVVPVPDTIVHAVVLAGESLAIVASTSLIGDGPVIERRDLLTFAPAAWGPEFVGALPSEVGVTEMSEGGDYTWSHAIRAHGPDCLQLTAGEASGHTFEHVRDDEDGVQRPIRPPFQKLAGDWRITPQGPLRGCPRQ